MAEYIELEAVMKHKTLIPGFVGEYVHVDRIREASTADVAPVVHSHWVHDSNNLYGCYRCGERETMSPKKLKKFCHECGARMDGE